MAFETLPDDAIHFVLAHGEFPPEITKAAPKVAVILTQDWCPDWHVMEAYLPEFADQVKIFVLQYNLHPEFEAIMGFKENTFQNREIPYLRYYRDGELITASNALPRGTFAALLQKTKPFRIV